MSAKLIAVNENGRRIGDSHHNAVLTDGDVERLRELHAERAMGYRKLAQKFEVSKSLVRDICKGYKRGQVASAWRKVHVTG